MQYRITNISNADIVIEDLSIRLSGKGSVVIVDADTANKSKDLQFNRNLVRIDRVGEMRSMPIWPFVKPTEPELAIPEPSVVQDINEIKLMLSSILSKINSEPKPETRIIIEKTKSERIPEIQEPMFIPSRILPDGAETNIQPREREISKNDLSKGVQILKKLRSRVK